MPMDLSPLIDDFHKFFLDLYHRGQGEPAKPSTDTAPGSPFLAFEGFGTPLTPGMFTLQNGEPYQPLVVEQFSRRANQVPKLQGGTILAPGLLSVDGVYDMLLGEALPLTAGDMDAFGAIKGPAQKAFSKTVPATIPGAEDFHPVLPTPPDWPLPSGAGAWSSHSFEQAETVTVTGPPIPSGPAPNRPPAWAWRVAPSTIANALDSLAAVRRAIPPPETPMPLTQVAAHPAILRPMINAALEAQTVQLAAVEPRNGRVAPAMAMANPLTARSLLAARPASTAFAPMILRSDVMALNIQELSRTSKPQTVTSKHLKLSFDYCLVTADRPWLSTGMLAARNWFLPRTRAGELASGTGTGDGAIEVVPVAALVVKNLVIEADWSNDETASLESFVTFGPFSLIGRSVAAARNSITCSTMQIIGWILAPMPCLPPNSDPALP